MRSFTCDSCHGTLYFENDTCLACGQKVGFRADEMTMCTAATAAAAGAQPCNNWTQFAACNWFAPAGSGEGGGYCVACALNEVVPNLTDQQRRTLWIATERAKRRLVFTLLQLGLPLCGFGGKQGLRFRLLADARVDTGAIDPPQEEPIYIGHDNGCLTVNVVEADDVHRETIRKRLNERYRTMLGHLRHESGHYYWYLLVGGTPLQPAFRQLFGDEQTDYATALRKHYESGSPPAWDESFVSSYARAHPWEDFAETWAHYIHIVDTLEAASDSTIAIAGRPIVSPLPLTANRPFAETLADWGALTISLNQLNRSMGMPDAYPFALTARVIDKLAFVHELCLQATLGSGVAPSQMPVQNVPPNAAADRSRLH